MDVTGLGTVFCGGAIGKGGKKMCAVIGCTVLSHAMTEVALDTREHPMDTNFVFIQSTTKKHMHQLAVFVKPFIPVSSLGARLSRYLSDSHLVSSWEMWFIHLGSMFELEQEDAEVAQMFA